MKLIYGISTYVGTVLLLLLVIALAVGILGSFIGLNIPLGLEYFIPLSFVGLSLLGSPILHRKIFRPTD